MYRSQVPDRESEQEVAESQVPKSNFGEQNETRKNGRSPPISESQKNDVSVCKYVFVLISFLSVIVEAVR